MRSLIIIIIALVAGIFCFIMEQIAISKKRLIEDSLINNNWRIAGNFCFFIVLLMVFIFLAKLVIE